MSQNKMFRTLLPANEKDAIEPLIAEPAKEMRRNCSGTTPCNRCSTESRQCLYDHIGDRRRKAYTAGLLNSHAALRRLAAKLRSAPPEEISWLVWEIQSLPNDEDAVNYLIRLLD
ncbi:hypothetical protein N7466_011095 [Penicillium verhagenii]|uniref:uncharacterized protein n=1 Tax=Penicillium verhagenii TaxID=1562060 RepID=UPI00254527C8|nr:uncharacterized protein N7466_011095 [Penicillium verhagenii]KAJ5917541.1 hypothetical protein N7466_011095 [Penicillium verhagenii]